MKWLFERIESLHLDEAAAHCVRAVLNPMPMLILTPNVQHVVMLERDQAFRRAYARAHVMYADGFPVSVVASAIRRCRVRRVTGADLLPKVLETLESEVLVYVIGAEPASVSKLRQMYSSLRFAHEACPAEELEEYRRRRRLVDRVASQASMGSFIVIGLGSPKEVFLAEELLAAGVRSPILCCGAATDFLTGRKPRAPRILRQLGLEWAFRVSTEPKRLTSRYARSLFPFLRISLSAFFESRRSAP